MDILIKRHEAPPQIAPPPTYTLTLSGLTERELSLLRLTCNASYRIPNMLADQVSRVFAEAPQTQGGRELMQLLSRLAMAIADKDVRPMSLTEFNR